MARSCTSARKPANPRRNPRTNSIIARDHSRRAQSGQGARPRLRYDACMSNSKAVFLRDELTAVLGSSGVYALRMLGLYMALPIMSTWAAGLPGATPFLVGLSLGAYGLTQ